MHYKNFFYAQIQVFKKPQYKYVFFNYNSKLYPEKLRLNLHLSIFLKLGHGGGNSIANHLVIFFTTSLPTEQDYLLKHFTGCWCSHIYFFNIIQLKTHKYIVRSHLTLI